MNNKVQGFGVKCQNIQKTFVHLEYNWSRGKHRTEMLIIFMPFFISTFNNVTFVAEKTLYQYHKLNLSLC